MSIFNFFKKSKSSSELGLDVDIALRTGNFSKALKICSEGIELYPNEVNFYLKRAQASFLGESLTFGVVVKEKGLLRLKDYDKAIQLMESDSYPIEYFRSVLAKAYFDRACQKNLLGDNDGAKNDGLKSQELGHPQKEFSKLPIDLTE